MTNNRIKKNNKKIVNYFQNKLKNYQKVKSYIL